jgi:GLPGLI family protein
MKNTLILFLVCISTGIYAQVITSGKIKYKETVKFDIKLENDSPIAKMLPSTQDLDKLLFFNTKEAVYTNKGMGKDQNFESKEDNGQVKITFKIPESVFYTNLGDKSFIHETAIMDKPFLVEDNVVPYKWQITGEQKMILDLPCQKAILQDDNQEVIVWFTSRIPVSIGPNDLNGLPGLILIAEYPKRNRAIVAESIAELPNDYVFAKPKDGKKVKKAEFDKIKAEKDKEMGAQGGGRIRIVTEEIKN